MFPVLSSYQPLAIDDVRWVLLAEVDASEAFAPIDRLAGRIARWSIALANAIVALLVSRAFVGPLVRLEDGARRLGAGERDVEVTAPGHDEVARLTSAFNGMSRRIGEKERVIEEKNEEDERLLLNILPEVIATRLKAGPGRIADAFPNVSVLFADIVGFTMFANGKAPAHVVSVLDELFSDYDRLAALHGVEKIQTIGDAFMSVCGLPTARIDHAERIADMALDMLASTGELGRRTGQPLEIRIGLNPGPVVAGAN